VAASAAADLTALVVGDKAGMFGIGTSGEGCRPLPRPVTRCPFRAPNTDAPDRTAYLARNSAAR
jgi:hypothetical protein